MFVPYGHGSHLFQWRGNIWRNSQYPFDRRPHVKFCENCSSKFREEDILNNTNLYMVIAKGQGQTAFPPPPPLPPPTPIPQPSRDKILIVSKNVQTLIIQLFTYFIWKTYDIVDLSINFHWWLQTYENSDATKYANVSHDGYPTLLQAHETQKGKKGKRELILVLFVRLFDLWLFGFVGFLFLLVSGKGCGLWLWHSLDFSLTVFYYFYHIL